MLFRSCPVIIEVFCGSARVTASLKELGLVESFGVDHEVDKAIATAKKLDLTVREDQKIFKQWMKSPLVVGLFWVPPCGTCSLARNIQLRDSFGRKIPGPVPLRSPEFPEGLSGLRDKDRRRVSAANRLYEFLAEIIKEAVTMGLIIVVETPDHHFFGRLDFGSRLQSIFITRPIRRVLTEELDRNGQCLPGIIIVSVKSICVA